MIYANELYHHGVKGMRWGVRRYQNADGTRTSAGKRRESQSAQTRRGLSPKAKRAIKIGAAIGVTALAAYGATRLAKSEQGQKLINELLNKGGKTTLNIVKPKSDDPRLINPRARTPIPGYESRRYTYTDRRPWDTHPRVQRQLDRNGQDEAKKYRLSESQTNGMRDMISRGQYIRDDVTYRYLRDKAERQRRAEEARKRWSQVRANSAFDSDDEYTAELFRRNVKRLER